MIYIALEPQLDQWQDWVADTVILFGVRVNVSYDEYTGIPDSLTIEAPPLAPEVQFYVGDGTLNEWRNARYESNDHLTWEGSN